MSVPATNADKFRRTPAQSPDAPTVFSRTRRDKTAGRFPLVPLALAMSAGIVVDRFLNPGFQTMVVVAVTGVAGFAVGLRSSRLRLSAASVLLLCGIAGGLHHHLSWWSVPQDDISHCLHSRSTLMKVQGRIADRPMILKPREEVRHTAIPQSDVTWFTLNCEQIVTPDGRLDVSGRIRAITTGRLTGVGQGDQVTVLGEASGLPAQQNPGEFDAGDSLKRQQLRGIIRIRRHELVEINSKSGNLFTAAAAWLRSRCESALERCLSGTSRSIASALLIGDRSMISQDVRASFVESGTMHLLAVSGLHIGILTGFVFACCRLFGRSDRQSVLFVLALLAVYLAVADLRPPVIRACVLVSIWSLGKLLRRPSFSVNSLAGAAIVVLALNPTDLFDVGAQLSFLAVAAILWLAALRQPLETGAETGQQQSTDVLLPGWRQSLLPLQRWLATAYLTTGTIWLLTMPLVAAAFNVVPVVGLVVNVLLIPLVGVALCLGFVSLVLGVVHPVLAMPAGLVFDGLLRLLLDAVEVAAGLEYGHFYTAAPPVWWLLGIYTLAAMAMLWMVWRRGSAWVWTGAGVWILFGISLATQPTQQTGLRCTVLSVGHGLAVLVETPSGRTLLYDAGSLASSTRATRAVESALWNRGYRQIDAVVISHADVDHYNGVAALFGPFRISGVKYSPHFLDESQPGTVEIPTLAQEHNAEIEVIAAGDRIRLDPEVAIRVLQPSSDANYSSDNAASVVLEIEYEGRRILLTGDLEKDGLFDLMSRPPRRVDILQSPHHGSLAANPRSLAGWCRPTWIVASSGNRFPGARLRAQYGEYGPRVVSTFESGAIEFSVSPTGDIRMQAWGREIPKPSTAAEF